MSRWLRMLSRRGSDLAVLLGVIVLLAVVVVGLSRGGAPRDRAADLDRRLRCPVCKQVSIADSPSQTAADMRQIVQEQVVAGWSDAAVLAYFQSRYGDWVLLDPPARGRSIWLFLLPALAAVAGISVVVTRIGPASATGALSEADRARVAALVREHATARHCDELDQP